MTFPPSRLLTTNVHTAQCSTEGCARRSRARRLCESHYRRLIRLGYVGPAAIGRYRDPRPPDCRIEHCPNKRHIDGYCARHYSVVLWNQRRPGRQIPLVERRT